MVISIKFLHHITFSPAVFENSILFASHSCQHWIWSYFLCLDVLMGVMRCHCDFKLNFLMTDDVQCFFICWWEIYIASVKHPNLLSFSYCIVCRLLVCKSFFYVLDASFLLLLLLLLNICTLNIFLHSVTYLFIFLIESFEEQTKNLFWWDSIY